jgi:hypothetical protein
MMVGVFVYFPSSEICASSGEAEEKLIRALWLFDPFGARVLRWVHDTYWKADRLQMVEDGFLSDPMAKAIRDFTRQVNLGEKSSETLSFGGRPLTLYAHKGFLMIAEADSKENLDPAIPSLSKALDDAIAEDPLSFSQLLSGYDMPGKKGLVKRLSTLLQSQQAGANEA